MAGLVQGLSRPSTSLFVARKTWMPGRRPGMTTQRSSFNSTEPPAGKRPDMDWTDRRKRFRAILSGSRCVHPGSVYDPLSARIAEDLGFEIGMFAGSTASLTVLGAPDIIVLTLSEFAEQAYRICRAGDLALLV